MSDSDERILDTASKGRVHFELRAAEYSEHGRVVGYVGGEKQFERELPSQCLMILYGSMTVDDASLRVTVRGEHVKGGDMSDSFAIPIPESLHPAMATPPPAPPPPAPVAPVPPPPPQRLHEMAYNGVRYDVVCAPSGQAVIVTAYGRDGAPAWARELSGYGIGVMYGRASVRDDKLLVTFAGEHEKGGPLTYDYELTLAGEVVSEQYR
ncbi:MAG: hypothetical protein U0271_45305 [Polyangiaceae bacterium]